MLTEPCLRDLCTTTVTTIVALCLLLTALVAPGCSRKPKAIVAAEKGAPAAAPTSPLSDSSVVAAVDLTEITLAQLRERLRADKPSPQELAEAVVGTVIDALVLRELAVLGITPRADESRPKAVQRLTAEVFSAQRYCAGVSKANLRLAYMADLAQFKHPASWTLWSALTSSRPVAQALASRLKARLPPPPDLPTETTCTGPSGPVAESHAEVFEDVVAGMSDAATVVDLRRYTFFDRHDAKIPRGHFRETDPAVAAAVKALPIGGWTGPIAARDGYHVALVVCRDKRRFDGSDAPSVLRQLRIKLCQGAADMAAKEYVERLLKGATVTYRKDVLRRLFGKEALSKLPLNAHKKLRPTIGH
jgi:hypothetical protein